MIKDKFFVDETMHGTRLDIAITKYLGRKYSRNQIKNLILGGCVQINDENCKPKDKLVSGDEIEFNFNDYHDSSWMPEKIDFNVIDEAVYANLSSAEDSNSYNRIDYLSNGFIYQANNSQTSQSGGEFVYFAFAEAPFKNARAR